MGLIIAIIAVLAMTVLMTTIAVIVGIDLAVFLISAVLPFLLWMAAGFVASSLIVLLLGLKWKGARFRSTGHIVLTLVLGVVFFALYGWMPRNGYGFSTKDVALVAFYNTETGKTVDVVDSPERVEELRKILDDMKMHHHFRFMVPSYLASSMEKDDVFWLGIFDQDRKKLAEIHLVDANMLCVYHPGKDAMEWYDLYEAPKLKEIRSVREREKTAKTSARIKPLNEDAAAACFSQISYTQGTLIVPLDGFSYETGMKLKAEAVVQHETFSLAYRDLDLIDLAGMKTGWQNGETAQIPVPQDRLYKELTVTILLDGIPFSYDALPLLPPDMLQANHPPDKR